VCGGPKYYAYRVLDTRTRDSQIVCKIRGLTLNYKALKFLNFVAIRDMILRGNNGEEDTVVNVHSKKKIKGKRKVEEPYRLSPNPKKSYTEVHFSSGCD